MPSSQNSTFVVLDQSLRQSGGHHFDYAVHTLRAARELGFRTALACHRRFRPTAGIAADCQVLPLFRYHTYSRYSELAGIQALLGDADGSPIDRLLAPWGMKKRIRSFARGCAEMCRTLALGPADHVLATTVSDLDLLGLGEFLRANPGLAQINWHLQFHFDVFSGREPEHPQQADRRRKVVQRFRTALRGIDHRHLRFFGTSETLVRQYNSLGLAEFEELAYPINPVFAESAEPRAARPLRITCAGEMRAEKGSDHLGGIVREVRADCLPPDKAQFVVQGQHPLGVNRSEQEPGVEYAPYPLSAEAYECLVKDADVGLFLYDPDRYYARRAGVLGEFLTAGVPVVVPAGCWLAEQIRAPMEEYQWDLASRLRTLAEFGASKVLGSSPADSDDLLVPPRGQPVTTTLRCPPGATKLLVEVEWPRSVGYGRYFRCDVSGQHTTAPFSATVGRPLGRRTPILLPIDPASTEVRLAWSNAFGAEPLSLQNVRFRFLEDGASLNPLGAVGLVMADRAQASSLLREMIRHHAHYAATARGFAEQWRRRHDPRATVRQLVGCPALARRDFAKAA